MTDSKSQRRNVTAVLALVLGVLVSPMALPVGWFAREQLKRSSERGMGLAVAGIVLGAVSIVVWVWVAVSAFLWWLSL